MDTEIILTDNNLSISELEAQLKEQGIDLAQVIKNDPKLIEEIRSCKDRILKRSAEFQQKRDEKVNRINFIKKQLQK